VALRLSLNSAAATEVPVFIQSCCIFLKIRGTTRDSRLTQIVKIRLKNYIWILRIKTKKSKRKIKILRYYENDELFNNDMTSRGLCGLVCPSRLNFLNFGYKKRFIR
jgi:hypothetical protein